MNINEVWRLAAIAGSKSPCAKSKRGVVVWAGESILASKCNTPPTGFTCDGSDTCRASCGKVAVHAEQAAILQCLAYGVSVGKAEMLHTKVSLVGDSFVGVFGGPPSCPDCSKLILQSGIIGMWLIEERDGRPTPVRYTAQEFHEATLKNCGLHRGIAP